MVDNDGTDAIWIQESSSVEGFGHSGLIVQSASGDWYYFFWGASSTKKAIVSASSEIDAKEFLFKLDTHGLDMTTYAGVWTAMMRDKRTKKRITSVSNMYYFSGDYDNTFQFLSELEKEQDYPPMFRRQYSTLRNNCEQMCSEAMQKSNSAFSNCRHLIPNCAELSIAALADYRLLPNNLWEMPNPIHNFNVVS